MTNIKADSDHATNFKKKKNIGCLIAIIILFCIGVYDWTNNKTNSEIREFGFTKDQFIDDLKMLYDNVGISLDLREKEPIVGKKVVTTILLSNYSSVNITCSKETHHVESLWYIGSGDGSPTSGTDILLHSTMVAVGAIDPAMSKEERTEIMHKITAGIKEKTSFTQGHSNITAEKVKDAGFWVIIKPAESI